MTPPSEPRPAYDAEDFDADLEAARSAISGADCPECLAAAAPPARTPRGPAIAPGRESFPYRIGTHAEFVATMLDDLAGVDLGPPQGPPDRPLDALRTREASDPSVALLDAAAVLGDVATFYQERFAQEHYLHTAVERRSVEALAELVDYAPRPGAAATTMLAFTLEDGKSATIPAGAAAQSVPSRPGEQPQTFETLELLEASARLNRLAPLAARPQPLTPPFAAGYRIFLEGAATGLERNGPLLYGVAPEGLARVTAVSEDPASGRTTVRLRPWREESRPDPAKAPGLRAALEQLRGRIAADLKPFEDRPAPAPVGGPDPVGDLKAVVGPIQKKLDEFLPSGSDPLPAAVLAWFGSEQNPLTALRTLVDRLPAPAAGGMGAGPAAQAGEIARRLRVELLSLLAGMEPGRFPENYVRFELDGLITDLNGAIDPMTEPRRADLRDLFWTEFYRTRLLPELRAASDREAMRRALIEELDALLADLIARFGKGPEGSGRTIDDADVESWWRGADRAFAAERLHLAVADPGLLQVWNVVDRYLSEAKAGLPDDAAVIANVRGLLEEVRGTLLGRPREQIPAEAFRLLAELQSQQRRALPEHYPRVRPWIDAIGADLADAILRLTAEPGLSSPPPPDADAALANRLGDIVKRLTPAPRQAPPEPATLRRSLADVAAAGGDQYGALPDILPKVLSQLDERSRPSLVAALGQLDVNPPGQPTHIKTFRAQAKPFGADAPPRQVLDERGRPLAQVDWTIAPTQYRLTVTLGPFGQGFALDNAVREVSLTRFEQRGVKELINVVSTPAGDPKKLEPAQVDLLKDLVKEPSRFSIDAVDLSTGGRLTIRATLQLGGSNTGVRYLIVGESAGPSSQTVRVTVDQGPLDASLSTDNDQTRRKTLTAGSETLEAMITGGDAVPGSVERITFTHTLPAPVPDDRRRTLVLDREHKAIVPGSLVLVDRADSDALPDIRQVIAVDVGSFSDYGLMATATRLTLDGDWLKPGERSLADLRKVVVYAQSEPLPLAFEPYDADVEGDTIELDGIYPGLEPGRRLVVRGERTDLADSGGVRVAEAAVVLAVRQVYELERPGERLHTQVTLGTALAHRYRRATVEISGNVARASHGETVADEELGGPAAVAVASAGGPGRAGPLAVTLRAGPLTFLPAPVPRGVEPALEVYVDRVRWHEADRLAGRAPDERVYVVRAEADGTTRLLFGDGREGARPSPDPGTIRATYRHGLGLAGNVAADAISQLITRPLGVQGVTNPLPASGGADREPPESVRELAPLGVTSLDRLVGVPDYADFARNFAGIAKAQAAKFPPAPGRVRPRLFVTIAAAGGGVLDESSDLFAALRAALARYGDPAVEVVLKNRLLASVALAARLRIDPDHRWADVRAAAEAALLDRFGLARRALAQPLWLSEVVATLQGVAGVRMVAVDAFGALAPPEEADLAGFARSIRAIQEAGARGVVQDVIVARPARVDPDDPGSIRPAELAIVNPALAETLILNPWDDPRPPR